MALIELPYGRSPSQHELSRDAVDVTAPTLTTLSRGVDAMSEDALRAPIGTGRLDALVRAGNRVTVIVSDHTRAEPRAAFLAALRSHLPKVRLTVAIATGTHGRCSIENLGIPEALLEGAAIVDH